MSQIAVLAKLVSQPDRRDELKAVLLTGLLANAEGEAGTQMYSLFEDNADGNVLWMWEVYADQAALDLHRSSDGMKAAGPALAGLLAGRPELTFMAPAGGKGMPG
jgi:quinol monooxygenase YgiN